jgi:hypothetical protein
MGKEHRRKVMFIQNGKSGDWIDFKQSIGVG